MSTSEPLVKYPRTPHLESSRKGVGDDLDDVPFADVKGLTLVVEEKVDGANAAISFTQAGDLLLQSRGHFLAGGPREAQFALLKSWAMAHSSSLFDVLGPRYICYGEWCFAKHTEFYDTLPHYFLEFDLFDKQEKIFLDTPARHQLLAGSPICSVPVLARGTFANLSALTGLVGDSLYKSADWQTVFKTTVIKTDLDYDLACAQTDMSSLAEGLYIKHEADGVVVDRFKWVRSGFVQSLLDSDSHWQDRPLVSNKLSFSEDMLFSTNAYPQSLPPELHHV